MTRVLRGTKRTVIEACVIAAALAGAPRVFAETKTYCDDKCNLKYCTYTCCHITTTTIEGVEVITNINCSSSACCAHPEGSNVGGSLVLPTKVVEGISAPIKVALAGTKGLDASTIAVESDDKTRTVTLTGTVKSAAQRSIAAAAARTHAKAYKVINKLTIASTAEQKP